VCKRGRRSAASLALTPDPFPRRAGLLVGWPGACVAPAAGSPTSSMPSASWPSADPTEATATPLSAPSPPPSCLTYQAPTPPRRRTWAPVRRRRATPTDGSAPLTRSTFPAHLTTEHHEPHMITGETRLLASRSLPGGLSRTAVARVATTGFRRAPFCYLCIPRRHVVTSASRLASIKIPLPSGFISGFDALLKHPHEP
jgi:hypothetical protein